MADDLDRMLQGEDTPSTLTGQNEGQQNDSMQGRPMEQQTEEEVEFNRLSGSTQDRIRELVHRAKEAENKLGFQQPAYVPPAPNTITPDQRQAVETLSQFGIATKDTVKQEVSSEVNQLRKELKSQQLETKYSGSNGEPKYDREEVEDYIKSHPQYQYYDPEDVFKFKMFPDEFSGTQTTSKPRTQSLRPTKNNPQASPFSDIDALQQRLAQPDGDEYYEAHKEEINRAVSAHTEKFRGTNFGGQ